MILSISSVTKIYFIKKQCLKDDEVGSEKKGFQLMQILGLLGMYFDTVVVFVTKFSLLFKLALAILWEILSSLFFVSTLIVPNEYLTIPFIQTYPKLSLAACLLTQIHSHKSFCG